MDNDSQYRNRRNRMFNKMEAYVTLKAVAPWIINNRDRRWKIPMDGKSNCPDTVWGDPPKELWKGKDWNNVFFEAILRGGRAIIELEKAGNPYDENATDQITYLLATVELIHPDYENGTRAILTALWYDEEGYPMEEKTKYFG